MPTLREDVASPVRSLAADVRARSDAELRTLLMGRPDLAMPAPTDLTSLAARAGTRGSSSRALDGLDQAHLQVLDALAVSGEPVDLELAASLLNITLGQLAPYVDRCWGLALLWRDGQGHHHLVRAVAEVRGPWPAGLGPSLVDLRGSLPTAFESPADLDALITQAPSDARAILDRLAWGPPVGQFAPGSALEAAGRWLLTHQLAVAHSVDHVVVPREVAMRLRGGLLHPEPALGEPDLEVHDVGLPTVDAVSGGQATEMLGLVDELCVAWGARPPRVLRAGGLAVRDLRSLRTTLDVRIEHAAFVAEVSFATGLVADDGALEPRWLPTPAYDEWSRQSPPARWARLASAWLASGRAAHLVGSTNDAGTVNALGRDVLWPTVRTLRTDVLLDLAALAPGHAPQPESLVRLLRWRRPMRRAENVQAVALATLREAEWLGVTGRGALSTAGRMLVEHPEDPEAAETAMSPSLPPAVEHVLLQADLTAVAPGRLEGTLAHLMRLVADVESRGGATVYRFSSDSIRRGLDAGWSADRLLSSLREVSQTPVPQPLEYLVGDVARRHGSTRVGAAASYLRSDDHATLDAMVADRGLAVLQLRRIAPTVLVSPVGTQVVVELLREHGYAPVAEAADGAVVLPAASRLRTPARRPPAPARVTRLDGIRAGELVRALRAGETQREDAQVRQDAAPGPRLPSTDPAVTLSLLRDAAADRHRVWIGHADAAGQTAKLLFAPRRVEGGRAYGTVAGSPGERSFSVHRITGVAPA